MDIISSLRHLANGLNTDKGAYVTVDCSNLPPEYTKEDVVQFTREIGATFKTFTDMQEKGDQLLFDFSSKIDAASFASGVKEEFFKNDEIKAPIVVHDKSQPARVSSLQRYCHFYKAQDDSWYFELADQEYGERHQATTYGPFNSEDSAIEYLHANFSNPGGWSTDDSGNSPTPAKSPNGRSVESPSTRLY